MVGPSATGGAVPRVSRQGGGQAPAGAARGPRRTAVRADAAIHAFS